MGKYLRISSYIRKPFLIYDFATAPLEEKYIFFFIIEYARIFSCKRKLVGLFYANYDTFFWRENACRFDEKSAKPPIRCASAGCLYTAEVSEPYFSHKLVVLLYANFDKLFLARKRMPIWRKIRQTAKKMCLCWLPLYAWGLRTVFRGFSHISYTPSIYDTNFGRFLHKGPGDFTTEGEN